MVAPLLATKLYIPPVRPELVLRPRLVDRLRAGLARRLTLVCAPAGFGKTTLISEGLRAPQALAAWLTLDDEDNDPARFLSYLLAALQTVQAGLGEEPMALLQSPQPPAPKAVLTALVNSLATFPGDLVLVLDDYQVVAAQQVHDAVAFLLEHLPPQVHLVVAGRTDPPLSLPRLRARDQVVEVRAADLRFTLEEAAAFLNQVMGLGLAAADVAALEARTEGWIAGLQLAALSLRGSADVPGFIAAFTGSNRYVLDYLVEEVLHRQDEEVQRFLLQTSILDRLSGPLCDAVLGEERSGARSAGPGAPALAEALHAAPLQLPADSPSQALLEMLEQSNLFTIALDGERRWYRYHRLFAEFLRSRLRQAYPEQVSELHRRAAHWYAEHGWIAEAVPHALAAQDWAHAAGLVEQAGQSLLMRSEMVTLQKWLDLLPDDQVRSHPRLCVFRAWVLILRMQMDAAEPYLECAEQALAAGGAAGDIQGETLALRSMATVFRGDMHGAAELARQALEHSAVGNAFLRSVVAFDTGLTLALNGDAPAAGQALAEAGQYARQANNTLIAVVAMCQQAEQERVQGRLRRAEEVYRQLLRWVEDMESEQLPIVGMAYNGLGDLRREWNRLDEAEELLSRGIALCRQWDELAAFDGYVNLFRVRRAQGDSAGAVALAREIEALCRRSSFVTMDEFSVTPIFLPLWMAQGQMEVVERWAEAAVRFLAGEWGQGLYPYVGGLSARMMLARVRLVQERAGEALALLDPLLPDVERLGQRTVEIEILLLQARAHAALDHAAAAQAALERALLLAEPEGYVRIFLDEGEPVRALLRLVAARRAAPAYVQRLLAAFEGTEAQSPRAGRAAALVEPLSDRELEVLRLLADGMSNRAIAHRLIVAVGTVKRHINNIYGKLDVHSRTQAVARARELELI